MGDDNVTKSVLDLDNSQFIAKMKEALGLMDTFGQAESLLNLSEKLVKLGTVAGLLTAGFLAVKTALDFTEESEHIDQLNNLFNQFATNAGLSATDLKEKLVQAAVGLATETEIIGASNKQIIALGDNAGRLPEIMELARKYTAAFGGDLISNFEGMSRALESGNAKMLRQYQITVDVTKAKQDYAQELNHGSEYLSDYGNKQAVFNAALVQAHKNLDGVNTTLAPVTTALSQLKTEFKEMGEAAMKSLGSSLSDVIMGVVKAIQILEIGFKTLLLPIAAVGDILNSYMRDMKNFGLGIYAVITGNEALKKSLNSLPDGQKFGQINWKATIASYDDLVKTINGHPVIKDLEKQTDSLTDAQKRQSTNFEKLKQDHLKFENDILKIKQSAEKDWEKVETDFKKFKDNRDQEMVTLALEASNKIKQIDIQAKKVGEENSQKHADAIRNIQLKLEADLKALRVKSEQDELTALKNLEAQNTHTATGFQAAWQRAGKQAEADLHNFSKLGETSFKSVDSHASAAFKSIGTGSKDAGEIMKGFFLGALGDMATSQGEFFLATGLGNVAGGNPAGVIQIAEGGALIALGAALSSMGQSTGSSAPSASGGGGSVGASPIDTTASAAPAAQAAQQKHLTVAINGNIFETDQTRTRLVDMIRQASDATDFQFTKIGSTF